jgi:predicted membrane-bound spermidine synthase
MTKYLALAFWSGFAGMALEMALARLVAPFFGSSLPVWAVIISVVLLSIALGYALGGRLSLGTPSPLRILGKLLLAAGAAITIISLGAPWLLGVAAGSGKGVSPVIGLLALLGFGLVASLPLVALSATVPLCVRAGITDVAVSGRVAARIYAGATVGSLTGTLLTVFVFLPLLGIKASLISLAAVCLAGAVALAFSAWRLITGIGLLALAASVTPRMPGHRPLGSRVLLDTSTPHHARVLVRERANGRRELLVDQGWSIQSVFPPGGLSQRGAWPLFRAAPLLMAHRTPERALVIGLAGGTVARDLDLCFPDIAIDGVEVDGDLVAIARRYMGLPSKVNAVIADGRRFLAETDRRYDLIYVDAYRDLYIPAHLATKEFFELAATRLRPGGVLAVNALTYRDEDSLARALGQTMRAVFPSVDVLRRSPEMNMLLFGYSHPRADIGSGEGTDKTCRVQDPAATRLAARVLPFQPSADLPVLSDDRAPIAGLTHEIAWRMLTRARPLPIDR